MQPRQIEHILAPAFPRHASGSHAIRQMKPQWATGTGHLGQSPALFVGEDQTAARPAEQRHVDLVEDLGSGGVAGLHHAVGLHEEGPAT
ncbi:hypothetical protein SAMN05446589_5538 [Streptomyces sp. OV198]|jgi:hypothetical protein|nr:hypothetical protein SAMN05446589_5538 [Streptomyces sp. OV198]